MIKPKKPLCPRILTCAHCRRLDHSGRIISHSTNRKYKCIKKGTCRSSNLIYCIECNLCQKQYVGQTKNQLRVRMNNHLSTIRNSGDTPVARHFECHNMTSNPQLTVYILQLIRGNDEFLEQQLRNDWENIWIARLYTLVPKGMNIHD